MATVFLDPQAWATAQFGECELGDRRRTKRLVKFALQAAAHPDGSTPAQCESWSDCKAAYRLFDEEDVTFDGIIAPHCQATRLGCEAGRVKLIINDTTEVDFGRFRKISDLGPTGNGWGRGFFLHSALMLDGLTGSIEGLAGQKLFFRKFKPVHKRPNNTRRRSNQRESLVWGELIDAVGAPPECARWIHVCDRGADDFEIFSRAIRQGCGFVIRAARLKRRIITAAGQQIPLDQHLQELAAQGTRDVEVLATKKAPARTARVEIRYAAITIPPPHVKTPWMRKHGCEPLPLWVVELREVSPPSGATGLRWVLYSTESVTSLAECEVVIGYYEERPVIEDFHKALKTGCRLEDRLYETAARLQRVAGLLSITAVRLLQLKTVSRETPNRPAREVAPARWVEVLQVARGKQINPNLTIYQFMRQLAGLGGHLGRKRDGEPGWITLWRGIAKLQLILRGVRIARQKCG